ncbi:MAG: DUF1997 domain-containing protein [Snowella sp.]
MQSQIISSQMIEFDSDRTPNAQVLDGADAKAIHFQTHFEGYMEMYSDGETVAQYLQSHEGWFCRCAQPMTVEPYGENGYILTVGRFGALGFDVEPKIAVVLEPPQDGQYFMHTIPLPDPTFLGYEVDYQAVMTLNEIARNEAGEGLEKVYRKQGINELPENVTKVQWQLNMDVAVFFPKYIHKLPQALIRKTGDRLLAEIIRQVSPRLTFKVQQDFHEGMKLPLPPKSSRHFQRVRATDAPDETKD